MPQHNKIDLIEFPVKTVAELKQTRNFFSQVFGWKYNEWGEDYSDTMDSGTGSGINADHKLSMPLTVLYSEDLEQTKELIIKNGGKIIVDTRFFLAEEGFTLPNRTAMT
ncbi:MAG: VOC family protein [Candidatus Doudnabacteria bacterium]